MILQVAKLGPAAEAPQQSCRDEQQGWIANVRFTADKRMLICVHDILYGEKTEKGAATVETDEAAPFMCDDYLFCAEAISVLSCSVNSSPRP